MALPFQRKQILDMIVTLAVDEVFTKRVHYLHAKSKHIATSSKFLTACGPAHTTEYIVLLTEEINDYVYKGNDADQTDVNQVTQYLRTLLLEVTLAKKIDFTDQQFIDIIKSFLVNRTGQYHTIFHWPVHQLVQQIFWKYGSKKISTKLKPPLGKLVKQMKKHNLSLKSSRQAVITIESMLNH